MVISNEEKRKADKGAGIAVSSHCDFQIGCLGRLALNKNVIDVREQATWLSGGRVCKAAGTSSAKTLRRACSVLSPAMKKCVFWESKGMWSGRQQGQIHTEPSRSMEFGFYSYMRWEATGVFWAEEQWDWSETPCLLCWEQTEGNQQQRTRAVRKLI